MSELFAHSLTGHPPEHWHRLDDHLKAVAGRARQFANAFSSGDWACNAGWLHDVGKAADGFQAYIRRENGLDDSEYDCAGSFRVNHSSAGAALAEQRFNIATGLVLAYLAAGHHAGLPDWYSNSTGNAALTVRLEEGRDHLASIDVFSGIIARELLALDKPPSFVKSENFHLWVRMLFSCLVDADFLDTEAFMQSEQAVIRSQFLSLDVLKQRLDQRLATFKTNPPINDVRHEILCACRSAALHPPGMFSLTVPTGGGKTLSSLAFALEHALHHGKRRIIYVIPYTSIIEQTAAVFAGIFGADNVVEHHSNLDPDHETQRSRLAAENWDAPIIVTTNVQFFESLFAAKSSRCRKLHNIVNSVVILDEAQLLPPEWLDPCVSVLNELVRNYSVTVVLCTATQPALPKLDTPCEIMPDPSNLYQRLQRTEVHLPSTLDTPTSWEQLAHDLEQYEEVLCVVNTRRDCYDLYQLMPEGTIHLSALMCGQHRSAVIAEIKHRLQANEPVRVISTQLVEAGVDIDFPVVYRALCGLVSIAQSAGRCNREGRLSSVGQVYVFVPPKPAPRGLISKGESTTREMHAIGACHAHDPAAYARYFHLFYSKVNDMGGAWLRDTLVKDAPRAQFRSAGSEFKLIKDEQQRPVFVSYGDGNALVSQLRAGGPTRDLLRRLQRFTVNVPVRTADALRNSGLLEEVQPGFLAQCMPSLYCNRVGLNVFDASLSVQDLIC